jgi:hypothetical protein
MVFVISNQRNRFDTIVYSSFITGCIWLSDTRIRPDISTSIPLQLYFHHNERDPYASVGFPIYLLQSTFTFQLLIITCIYQHTHTYFEYLKNGLMKLYAGLELQMRRVYLAYSAYLLHFRQFGIMRYCKLIL